MSIIEAEVEGGYAVVDEDLGEIKKEYQVRPVSWNNPKWTKKGEREGVDELDHTKPGDLRRWSRTNGYRLSTDVKGIVTNDEFTPTDLRVFLYIGHEIEGLNISFITLKDIEKKLRLSQGQVSKCVAKLEGLKYIHIVCKNTFGVGSRVIFVNPSYFWMGDYRVRDNFILDWCRKVSVPVEERLYSCPLIEWYVVNTPINNAKYCTKVGDMGQNEQYFAYKW